MVMCSAQWLVLIYAFKQGFVWLPSQRSDWVLIQGFKQRFVWSPGLLSAWVLIYGLKYGCVWSPGQPTYWVLIQGFKQGFGMVTWPAQCIGVDLWAQVWVCMVTWPTYLLGADIWAQIVRVCMIVLTLFAIFCSQYCQLHIAIY